ncbi:DUF4352 domain-containing protein [Nocardia thailandica]|uniref:DUF4352 domain-containing protein n=1 Tax=Nocardia thailandica TaxID=257275 RepID=A0ABW6PLV1_9NOCA
MIVLSVLAGVFVLCGFGGCVAALGSGTDKGSKAAPTFTQPAGAPAAAGGAGAPSAAAPPSRSDVAAAGATVRDGKFEFTVTAIDPPVKTVGSNPYLQKTAQGEYLLVYVRVTNIGNKAQTYWSGNQKLIDDRGREFENDTMAGINVNEGTAMSSEINPGNSVDVVVVFDIPAGTTPAALELHDSAFSGGAKVALR